MTLDCGRLAVCAVNAAEQKAAALLCDALYARSGVRPPILPQADGTCIRLRADVSRTDKDSFSIRTDGGAVEIAGQGIRALIFGFSYLLRKSVFADGSMTTVCRTDGDYMPDKRIRGHQLGYRAINNTYDAWTTEQYRQYYLDLMAFGSNTVEHIPAFASGERSGVMRYDPDDLLVRAARIADEYDLDVSLWTPNDDQPRDESVRKRADYFAQCPRIDAVFPPGGDPGDLPAAEFLDRACAIGEALKKTHPKAQMWPSAQAPHSVPNWGEAFIARMQTLPDAIDGIITGPNRAFPLDELRRRLPMRYPIRLYPDITHNVRCEYPVHVLQDDWHYAFAAALSRESINPRPEEYRLIHRLTRAYVCGSVSYSEGVNDDVNKMVWADMDFDPRRPLRETLLDYARFFIWQAPAERIADLIFGLERNWIGDPAENPHIESTLQNAQALADEIPSLSGNWRFCQLLFRASCDALVRRRRLFETALLNKAKEALRKHDLDAAESILQTPFPADYDALHGKIESLAGRLYDLIGMQLSTARHGASHWERGATLDTLDLPVTDRAFYRNRIAFARTLDQQAQKAFLDGLLARNNVHADEYYFSFAEHGFDVLGERQTPDFYMDFQGDRPNVNDGSIPMCQLKLYDHFSFRCRLAGFTQGDYKLRVTYSAKKNESVTRHTVKANGRVIYCGAQYGGERNPQFDANYLAPGTKTATYLLPADVFENGCLALEISEPSEGVKLSEFWIIR